MNPQPLVTIITPTMGKQYLNQAIESVREQSYPNIQHLVIADGIDISLSLTESVDFMKLPYNVGADRYNGHRIYGAFTYIAKGELICFLDDDNWLDRDHIKSLVEVINQGYEWAYSLRKIVDTNGIFICNDECESLGNIKNIFGKNFVDVNCYLLPRMIAVNMSPVWFRKFREPGQIEIDQAMINFLLENGYKFNSNNQYSVNYRVGNTNLSVSKDFFLNNNLRFQKKNNYILQK